MPSFPYTSGQGAVVKAFEQMRKSVPSKVDAAYLKRFNIAPANESYVISIIRFLGLIDDEGAQVPGQMDFLFGSDASFVSGMDAAVRAAYKPLFDDLHEDAWETATDALVHWFRTVDKTSDTVGKRQAATFRTLAAFAGHGEPPQARQPERNSRAKQQAAPKPKRDQNKPAAAKPGEDLAEDPKGDTGFTHPPLNGNVGLTVRIEVNLPAGADSETYDAIFASIRKNLMQ